MAAGPTPGIRRILDFVNTYDAETKVDELDTPERVAAWFAAHGLLPANTAVSAAQARRAIQLRERLRRALLAHHGGGGETDVPPEVGAVPLQLVITSDGGAELLPLGDGVDAALGALVAPVPAAVADGTWARAKVCPADDCEWAFFDQSKNRSRRWCSMDVCGNREKSQAFRARHRSG